LKQPIIPPDQAGRAHLDDLGTHRRGVPFNITWAAAFNNAAFAQVDIEFVDQAGGVIAIGNAPVAAGALAWMPIAPPLPALPVRGTIRITPVGSNFPVHSGLIQV
jgi:hypothetical protein